MLGERERGELVETQRKELAEAWEVELVVATARIEWNDFGKGPRSMWRLTLVGDDGREVLPISVKLDRRSREELGVYYPAMKPFYKAYVVRFPRVATDGKPLVRDGSPKIQLKIGSGMGGILLEWSAE
jgi:hypothetical protein